VHASCTLPSPLFCSGQYVIGRRFSEAGYGHPAVRVYPHHSPHLSLSWPMTGRSLRQPMRRAARGPQPHPDGQPKGVAHRTPEPSLARHRTSGSSSRRNMSVSLRRQFQSSRSRQAVRRGSLSCGWPFVWAALEVICACRSEPALLAWQDVSRHRGTHRTDSVHRAKGKR
jgi:hypothetical protein